MIEIIEQTKGTRCRGYGRIYQYKCQCGCRFNAQYPDDYRTDKYGMTLYVQCPVCGMAHTRSLIAEWRYYFNSLILAFLKEI